MKSIKLYLFTATYLVLCVLSMFFIIEDNKNLQLYIKPFVSVCLLFMYISSVEKVNVIYCAILLFVFAGHCFIIYPDDYFQICLYLYLIASVLTSVLIFQKILKNKSFFNIFTFALPFFMAFMTVFLLISKNLEDSLIVPIFVFGIAVCISGSIVLLNYSQNKDIGNYLIFIGVFTIITADASAALYQYGKMGILYYQLLILFDYLGQYAFCRGLIMKQQESSKKDYLY